MRAAWTITLCLFLAACQTALPAPGVRIEGNQRVEDDDLRAAAKRHLEAFRTNHGRLADADDAAYAMQVHLRSQGHPEANVRFEASGQDVVFHVAEGPRAEFGRVRFEGVKSVPEAELAKLFEFDGSGLLALDPPQLDPAEVESAVSGVEALYLDRGFRAVRVKEPRLDWNAQRTSVDVLVRVEEGRRYTVSGVELGGLPRSYLGGENPVGQPYRQGLAFQLAGRVRRRLRDEGYALAEVQGTADIDADAATVRIVLEVERGERIRLRKLAIRGNSQTNTGFIRKRFDLRPGEVIKRARFETGVADLYRSHLFSRVGTKLDPVGADQADLTVDVEEGDSKRLDLEVGWGSWELLRGRVEYKDYNLAGWGRILRATAVGSLKSYGAEIELEDPWILGQDNRLWWNVHAHFREERFYDYYGAGTELGVHRRFDRRWQLWGGYRFRVEEARDVDADIPPADLDELQDLERSAGLFLRAQLDTRDDRFLPQTGLLLEASTFWSTAPLGASLEYVELDVRAAYHIDLSEAGVLVVGARGATRQSFRDTVLPIQQRYFLGGQHSVRSFGRDELTPVAPNGQGIGGLTAAEAHAEWRKKIYDIVHGALFYDVGIVSQDPFSLDGIVGHGVGAGLRFYTPVGPVRFDVGYNPGRLYGATSRWQLFFSFGFSF